MFEWNRSNTLIHGQANCTHCKGMGARLTTRNSEVKPCKCALRSIFRKCFDRFRAICEQEREGSPRKTAPLTWSRVREEYVADFILMTERTLSPAEYKLFRIHFLLGADWKLCTKKLNIDKGLFFHAVYRIQEKLGRAFTETEPYGLFPLDEYFGGTVRNDIHKKPVNPTPSRALRPPVRRKTEVVASNVVPFPAPAEVPGTVDPDPSRTEFQADVLDAA